MLNMGSERHGLTSWSAHNNIRSRTQFSLKSFLIRLVHIFRWCWYTKSETCISWSWWTTGVYSGKLCVRDAVCKQRHFSPTFNYPTFLCTPTFLRPLSHMLYSPLAWHCVRHLTRWREGSARVHCATYFQHLNLRGKWKWSPPFNIDP